MGKFHHICIQTDKYKESLEFYTEILGFKIVKESQGFHNRLYNSWLEQEGFMIELQTNKLGEVLRKYNKNTKGIVHFSLVVDDIDKEYLRIKDLKHANFKSKNGEDIYEIEGGKLFKLFAPEGTIIEVRNPEGI
ncbi:VOC family protein [Clostridium sp. D2Q-11]|uniref:VOC family protein n=1 Tax=Anaeromonas frigoriresistens TaxID=2683708 RepID=A0A942UQN8_9FIRM|nr:VOC family protein [Anaeromonas frigoriresistens]MBS4537509.1 VOC family protein [Anaeromonas frigoriresistens]